MPDIALIALPWPVNHYKFLFASDEGKINAEVSIERAKGGRDDRSENEKRRAALAKLKVLVKSLDATLAEMEVF
ncbi:MAG TPA: hypothetical protein VHU22_19825 [Xanthobacteraceae bacterium]|jgi:hypothetical protein|nr:hypothetical protein [Xanthobacteraceae bacterium]